MIVEEANRPDDSVYARPKSYQVGDVVEYLPHICHAFTPNANNEYPWAIGLKHNPHFVENPATGEKELVEDVLEIEESKLHREVLGQVRNAPDPRDQRGKLVPLRPKKPWRAVVRGVHTDCTLDLEVESNVGKGMVTLHYARVPVDESGMAPHSCRKGGE